MLGRLKEGIQKSRPYVFVPRSKVCVTVLEFLYQGGYILGFQYYSKSIIRVELKYIKAKSYIKGIEVYTKPSRIVYYSYSSLQKALSRTDVVVLSTWRGLEYSNDIIDNFFLEPANENKIGGTMLFGLKV